MKNILVSQWNKTQFFSSKQQWNELLAQSNADALFLSWEWMSCWWQSFSDNNMSLCIIVAYDQDNRLMGIAPLYLSTVKYKFLHSQRLQFIGNCWRGKSTMPTELLSFITLSESDDAVTQAFFDYIDNSLKWDELVIPYLDTGCSTYLKSKDSPLLKYYHRIAEQYKSYYANTNGNFDDYLKGLGKNTRLKLYNRRKNLAKLGKITFEQYRENTSDNFSLLNELHAIRWDKAVFNDQRLEFNTCVAKLMKKRQALNFSVLYLDDRPISIQYNYIFNKHTYNIQAGFDPDVHPKIAPGYLHFGYEIEACFNGDNSTYDFLAGEGKNTQYKSSLTEDSLDMVDLQILRAPLLKWIFKLHDLYKQIL